MYKPDGTKPDRLRKRVRALQLNGSSDSDEEYRRLRIKTQEHQKKITENSCDMSIKKVESILHVKFVETIQSPKFSELAQLPIMELVKLLVNFAYEEDSKPNEEVMEEMWENPDTDTAQLKYIKENPNILIDVREASPDQIEKIMGATKLSSPYGLLQSVIEYLNIKDVNNPTILVDSPHEILKQVFGKLADMAGYSRTRLVRHSGETHLSFERLALPEDDADCVVVKVVPDFILGDRLGSLHCIPVEVFSSCQVEEKTLRKSHSASSSSLKSSSTESDDDTPGSSNSEKNASRFSPDLSELSLQLNERCVKTFHQKLCAQHVTQLYGIIEEYVKQGNEFPKCTFSPVIGLIMLDGHVFFSRMTVGAYYLWARLKKHKEDISPQQFDKNCPTIQFFPTAFDLSLGTHRLALGIFLTQHRIRFFPLKENQYECF